MTGTEITALVGFLTMFAIVIWALSSHAGPDDFRGPRDPRNSRWWF